VETKWHGTVLDLIIMLNGIACIATNVGGLQLAGLAFYRGFPLKLHREFLFGGFCGHNARVVVYGGMLYWGVSVYYVDRNTVLY
jgi:hypothetical protein